MKILGIDVHAVLTALLLLSSAWVVTRSCLPKRPAGRPRPRKGPRPEPAPIAGGATMLLESIPHLEPVARGRGRGTVKLLATIGMASTLIAVTLYVVGHTLSTWLSSYSGSR